MSKICTSVEQSKKLLELGLSPETADMYIGNYVGKDGTVDGTNVHYYCRGEMFGAPEIINAWSLSALLELIPNPTLRLATTDCWELIWGIGEIDCDGYFEDFGTVNGNTPINAAYNTIVYLIEQDYIKTEKK